MTNQYAVLFVDDDIHILNSIRRGLIDEDYRCFFAESGSEALEILKKNKISVIVTDMRMPQMDGLTLLKEVKGKYPNIVKIVLSGYTQLQQILATINNVDIFKFITKPWKMEEEFKVIIRQALDYYKYLSEKEEIKCALEVKNQAYQNIFKNIDHTILGVRNSLDFFGNIAFEALEIIGEGVEDTNKNSNRNDINMVQQDVKLRIRLVTELLRLLLINVNEERKDFSIGSLVYKIVDNIEMNNRDSDSDKKVGVKSKFDVETKFEVESKTDIGCIIDVESKIDNSTKVNTNFDLICAFLTKTIQIVSTELGIGYVKIILLRDEYKGESVCINLIHKGVNDSQKTNVLFTKEIIARIFNNVIGLTLHQINCEYVCKVISGVLIQKIVFIQA